jgi:uncharacterized membrane protein YjdF
MKRGLKWLLTITGIILIGFLFLALSKENYEFIGYWIVLVIAFLLIISIEKKFKIPIWALTLFAIWTILHMAGGLIYIMGTRLYDLILINILGDPFFILKYDQVIHLYCYFSISILIYFVLKNYIKKKESALITFSILSALGIGLLNEVIEFAMVVFANAADAVGGYYNTALDLVFNLIGAIIGPLFVQRITK